MRIVIIGILLLLSATFFSQKYNFKNFSDEDFKAKYVYDFVQDTNGVLYIATSKGLVVYDGVKFEEENVDSGLKQDFISKLFLDTQNNLWVSYYESGLTKIKKKLLEYQKTHFEIEKVNNIYQKDSNLIITSVSGETHSLAINSNQIILNTSSNDLGIIQQIEINNGNRVFLSSDGIYFEEGNKVKKIKETNDQYIRLLTQNEQTNTFTYIADEIVYCYKYDKTPMFVNAIPLSSIGIDTKVTDIVFQRDKLTLATMGQGFVEVNFTTPRLQAYNFVYYNEKNGLSSNFIQSLFIDRENQLWIGYYGQGLSVFLSDRTLWYDKSSGLIDNNILSVTNFKGNLVVGTNFGFSVVGVDTIINYNENNRFIDDKVKSLLANDNQLWIGTEKNGLFCFEDGEITPFKFSQIERQPTCINHILLSDRKMYLGTNTGLYIYDFSTKEELHITMNEGLVHNVVEYIYQDSKGKFWFDSPVSPIYSYQNGEFTLYKDIDGFKSFELSQIYETANKEILFSTMGDGLFIFKDGKFEQFNTENSNLISDYVYFIVEDMKHKVWMGHKNGLSRLDIETKKIDQLNKKDNPLLRDVNITAIQLSADNKLWIGTESGLVKLNINQLNINNTLPKIDYKGLLVDDSLLYQDRDLTLDYSDYQLDFQFQTVNLSNPKSITYQYKLEGFDKKWNVVNYDKLNAKYQSVIDGEYKFRLRVCINDVCQEEIEIEVVVEKPFWKTIWAMILLVLVCLLILFSIHYLLNKRKKKLMKRLEIKVKKRTIELSKANRKLEEQSVKVATAYEEIKLLKKALEQKKENDDSLQ